MIKSERDRIKKKIFSINPEKWWGDDFDVRFLLISKLKSCKNKKILDLGGGIGIISSELNKTNFITNLDMSYIDLKICKDNLNSQIFSICGNSKNIPFKNDTFDYVISSSMLQYLRSDDIKKKNVKNVKNVNVFPSAEKSLSEINRILKNKGKLILVTPNNSYYNSYMFDYNELEYLLKNNFKQFKIYLFNTYPRISKRYRKLNLANIFPKFLSILLNPDKVIRLLLKNTKKNNQSVSFFIEAVKKSE